MVPSRQPADGGRARRPSAGRSVTKSTSRDSVTSLDSAGAISAAARTPGPRARSGNSAGAASRRRPSLPCTCAPLQSLPTDGPSDLHPTPGAAPSTASRRITVGEAVELLLTAHAAVHGPTSLTATAALHRSTSTMSLSARLSSAADLLAATRATSKQTQQPETAAAAASPASHPSAQPTAMLNEGFVEVVEALDLGRADAPPPSSAELGQLVELLDTEDTDLRNGALRIMLRVCALQPPACALLLESGVVEELIFLVQFEQLHPATLLLAVRLLFVLAAQARSPLAPPSPSPTTATPFLLFDPPVLAPTSSTSSTTTKRSRKKSAAAAAAAASSTSSCPSTASTSTTSMPPPDFKSRPWETVRTSLCRSMKVLLGRLDHPDPAVGQHIAAILALTAPDPEMHLVIRSVVLPALSLVLQASAVPFLSSSPPTPSSPTKSCPTRDPRLQAQLLATVRALVDAGLTTELLTIGFLPPVVALLSGALCSVRRQAALLLGRLGAREEGAAAIAASDGMSELFAALENSHCQPLRLAAAEAFWQLLVRAETDGGPDHRSMHRALGLVKGCGLERMTQALLRTLRLRPAGAAALVVARIIGHLCSLRFRKSSASSAAGRARINSVSSVGSRSSRSSKGSFSGTVGSSGSSAVGLGTSGSTASLFGGSMGAVSAAGAALASKFVEAGALEALMQLMTALLCDEAALLAQHPEAIAVVVAAMKALRDASQSRCSLALPDCGPALASFTGALGSSELPQVYSALDSLDSLVDEVPTLAPPVAETCGPRIAVLLHHRDERCRHKSMRLCSSLAVSPEASRNLAKTNCLAGMVAYIQTLSPRSSSNNVRAGLVGLHRVAQAGAGLRELLKMDGIIETLHLIIEEGHKDDPTLRASASSLLTSVASQHPQDSGSSLWRELELQWRLDDSASAILGL